MIIRFRITPLLAGCLLALCPASGMQRDGASQRLLVDAQRLEREGRAEEARKEYELLVERFPQSGEAETALLALAESYWRAGQTQQATGVLDRLTGDYPDSPVAAAAWVLRGRFLVEDATNLQQLEEARTPFRRVPLLFGASEYPSLDARVEARVRSGEVQLMLGEPQLAAVVFLQAIEGENDSPWRPQALYGYARSLLDLGDWPAGAEVLQRVVDDAEADEALRMDASTDLGLVHRQWLRPSIGERPWSGSRSFPIAGVELRRPERLAADRHGRILLYDSGLQQVLLVSPAGEILQRSSQSQVRDVWFSPDGEPFVALEDAVLSFADGQRQTFTAQGAPVRDIGAGTTGILDQIFLLDRDEKTVWAFDRKGGARALITSAADVVDVGPGADGGILLLDRKQNQVSVLGPDGNLEGRVSGDWRRPQAVTADRAGRLYVLDAGQESVFVLASGGQRVATVGPVLGGVELRRPEDIAVDGQARLYIVDSRLSQVFIVE